MTLHTPSHPPLTIEALTTWLAKQDPGQPYTWQDPVKCLMGLYLADHGSAWGGIAYSNLDGYYEIAQTQPHTLGDAHKRALEYSKQRALPTPPANAELMVTSR